MLTPTIVKSNVILQMVKSGTLMVIMVMVNVNATLLVKSGKMVRAKKWITAVHLERNGILTKMLANVHTEKKSAHGTINVSTSAHK